jgi:hypothetical protein
MKYLQLTPYVYLIFGAYFIYDAIIKWNVVDATPTLSLVIAGFAIFMFFFRKKYAKKFENKNNKS